MKRLSITLAVALASSVLMEPLAGREGKRRISVLKKIVEKESEGDGQGDDAS